jgi:hypothetical protein
VSYEVGVNADGHGWIRCLDCGLVSFNANDIEQKYCGNCHRFLAITNGDMVRVYPHGSPKQSAEAKVIMLSSNGRSIAIGFSDKPPFAITRAGMMVHAEYGIVMLAMRAELNGQPWGPWVEVVDGGHYEIEAI